MKQADAIKLLDACAAAPRKIEAFEAIAKQLKAPMPTVYHWWREGKIPAWRLGAFDKLKVRK
jgi:excisionase family DNA binding protein